MEAEVEKAAHVALAGVEIAQGDHPEEEWTVHGLKSIYEIIDQVKEADDKVYFLPTLLCDTCLFTRLEDDIMFPTIKPCEYKVDGRTVLYYPLEEKIA